MRIPKDTALLIIDMQNAIDDPKWGPRNNPGAEDNIAALLVAWRGAGFPVVHIRHDSAEPASPYRPGQSGNAFKARAAPQEGEAVVAKQVHSAFIGTELEALLTRAGRTTLVVCGVLTNNSVESTVRHAGDLGFRVFVVSDACWAVDRRGVSGELWPAEAVHHMALANMSREFAGVADTSQAVAAVAARRVSPRRG